MSLIPDDPRAQFVIAQYLIDEGRIEEALPLVEALAERYPRLDDWVEKLKRGAPVDTASLRWEPDMVRPMPPRQPVQWKPGRLIIALLMALSLFLPVVQMMTYSRQPVVDEQALVRNAARERVQRLCERWVRTAIEDGRLADPVGSCMEWSFRLPSGHMRDVMRCHERSGPDDIAFTTCVLDQQIYPPGIRLPGTTSG